MYERIEKEFKKVSAYYIYRRISIIRRFTLIACLLVIFFSVGFVNQDGASVYGIKLMSMLGWQIFTVVILILFILFSEFVLDRFKPKERECLVWLRFFKIEKRNGYVNDISSFKKILKRNGINTTERLREVVNFYRSKKRIIIIGGGNFFTIIALCLTSVAFMFSVNDGYTDMRLALVILTVLFPLAIYYIIRFVKRQTNVYSDFYQVLEELLSEILVKEIDKKIKVPKTKTPKKSKEIVKEIVQDEQKELFDVEQIIENKEVAV